MVVGVATNGRGEVFVFQRTPHPVLVFDRDGRYLRTWGHGLFALPHGCRFDPQGNLWLTDVGRHQVFKYSAEGKRLATWGVQNRPGSDATHFNQPADVAFGPNGDVYIADGYGNARIVHLDASGRYRNAWGRRGTAPGEFRLVHSVAVDARGRVYVVDRNNARIQVFTAEGRFLSAWTHVGHPFGLFLTPDQRLFVADGIADTISIYSLTGKRLAQWGSTGSAVGKMRRAHLLCVDDQGAVYVAEVNGRRVQKFSPSAAAGPTPERRR
jgi:DNA-binding beta-propeller fold protein YncE